MKNFFEIFSLEEKFAIDTADLEKKYFAFQNQFHPDKSSADDISKSIEINEAYKILADDFLRASYLLQLKGVDILQNEKAAKVDMATLQHVLELQEIISELTDKNQIEELRKKINSEFRQLILDGVKQLESNNIQAATQLLVKAKYLKKSLEDLKIRKKKFS
jgi:molecular chaperone HscB